MIRSKLNLQLFSLWLGLPKDIFMVDELHNDELRHSIQNRQKSVQTN